jgi:hypothetical protein
VICLFEGGLGSGKSLCSTAFAVLDYLDSVEKGGMGRKIISSTHIYGIPSWELLDYEKFIKWMQEEEELENAIVILDEAYLFVDSRLSQSSLSRLMTYFFMQTRKRHVDLYVCSQQFENVDVRLRRNVDVRAICRYDKISQWCKVRLINMRTGRRRTIKMYGPEFFPYFDTDEIPKLRPAHTKITL